MKTEEAKEEPFVKSPGEKTDNTGKLEKRSNAVKPLCYARMLDEIIVGIVPKTRSVEYEPIGIITP